MESITLKLSYMLIILITFDYDIIVSQIACIAVHTNKVIVKHIILILILLKFDQN